MTEEWVIVIAIVVVWMIVGGFIFFAFRESEQDHPAQPPEEPEKPHVSAEERDAIKKKLIELRAKKARKDGRK